MLSLASRMKPKLFTAIDKAAQDPTLLLSALVPFYATSSVGAILEPPALNITWSFLPEAFVLAATFACNSLFIGLASHH